MSINKPITRRSALSFSALAAGLLTGCNRSVFDNQGEQPVAPSEPSAPEPAPEPETASVASQGYEDLLFNTGMVHQIDVSISAADWADLRANPTNKTKYHVDVTIDGETLSDVSFATKGNTSLSFVASNPESDRYSFKINFGKYVDDQTFHGLDKLNLNNLYADATYLKDHLSYELFRQLGVPAPLTSFAWLTVNGQDFGLYIAIEDVGKSFLARTKDGKGELYKPETEMLDNMDQAGGAPAGGEMPGGFAGGFGGDMPQGGFTPPEGMQAPEGMQPPEGMQTPQDFGGFDTMQPPEGMEMPQGFGGFDGGQQGFGGGSKGADLLYTDDSLESYSDIFDNAETKVDEEDERRIIAALKALSEGTDLEGCLDTDEVIRYFAAHNFVLNYDSYTGAMLHNYYLYEHEGRLSLFPWDYNLAFGGFGGGEDATSLVNTGIDTPLSTASDDARPMWAWIVRDQTYLSAYHATFDELLSAFFESGDFENRFAACYQLISPYVEKDPSAFYTAEQFEQGADALRRFCLARAQSVRAQLDGSLATKTSEQAASARIDASGIDVSAMGSNSGGQGMPQGNGQQGFPMGW